MSVFERHEIRLKVILEHLNAKGAQKHNQLMKVWIMNNGTLTSFSSALNWLKRRGYVQKKDERSPYEITEKGRKYLEGLRA